MTIAAGWRNGTLIGCQSLQGVFNVDFVLDATGVLHLSSTAGGQALRRRSLTRPS